MPAAGQFAGQPFPGNIIPANRISPVARAILEYYSLPKSPGLAGNIFDSTLAEVADYNTTTVRLDQQVSSNNKMFVRGKLVQARQQLQRVLRQHRGRRARCSSSSRTRP